jgi:IMP and pyridine-specific 5'-nucleotidase
MSKAEDGLISLILSRHAALSRSGAIDPLGEALSWAESLLNSHCDAGARGGSELSALVPSVGRVWLPLRIMKALESVAGGAAALRARRYVPPSFREIRRLFNSATVAAAALAGLRLLTLDADETIYDDGGTLEFDSPVIPALIRILRAGTAVAIVTAASYPGAPERFEARLRGLLSGACFAVDAGAPATLLDGFYVMGGQCNYLLRARIEVAPEGAGSASRATLFEVPGAEWKAHRGERWDPAAVTAALDVAEDSLRATAAALGIDVAVVRKERAVGVVPRSSDSARALSYEVLEELALAAQDALEARGPRSVPTCAFNGGRDVFVDIGTKALGIRALAGLTGAAPETSLHVGDRFTRSGNDLRARDVASTLWVDGPLETAALLSALAPLAAGAAAARSAVAAATRAADMRDAAAAADARALLRRPTIHVQQPVGPADVNASLAPWPRGGASATPSSAPSPLSASAAAAARVSALALAQAPSSFRRTLDSRLFEGGLPSAPSTPRAAMQPPVTPRAHNLQASSSIESPTSRGVDAELRGRVRVDEEFALSASRSAWLAGCEPTQH